MRQLDKLALGGLVLALVSTASLGQAGAEPVSDAEAARARINAAIKEQRTLRSKLYRIQNDIERSSAVADLRRAVTEASKAAYEAEKTSDAVVAARKAERAAYDALNKARQESLEADPEAAAVLREIEDLDSKRAALSLKAALAEVKLKHRDSPISRALAKDPKLAELHRATYKTRDYAARREATNAYKEARLAAEAEMPEAKALAAEIDSYKEQVAALAKETSAARLKLMNLQRALDRGGRNKAVTDANARLRAAGKAVRDAYDSPALKAAAATRDKARASLNEKVKQLLAGDEQGAVILDKMEALEKKIRQLQPKIRRRQPRVRR